MLSPPEVTQLELVYGGDDVDDGTIPVEYMIEALMGFSGAYGKIASRTIRNTDHRIRVAGISRGSSTHILLTISEWARSNPAIAIPTFSTIGLAAIGGAYRVLKDIGSLILGKKYLAGQEPKIIIEKAGVVLVNHSDRPFQFTKEQLEYLKTGLIDPDLDKITAPLDHARVQRFELNAQNKPIANVSKEERLYFVHSGKGAMSTKEDVWVTGTLNSLAKDKNRGTFHTLTGLHIPYRYVGQNKNELLRAFAHQAIVNVRGGVELGSDLSPISIQIHSIELGQRDLFTAQASQKKQPVKPRSKNKKQRHISQGQ